MIPGISQNHDLPFLPVTVWLKIQEVFLLPGNILAEKFSETGLGQVWGITFDSGGILWISLVFWSLSAVIALSGFLIQRDVIESDRRFFDSRF